MVIYTYRVYKVRQHRVQRFTDYVCICVLCMYVCTSNRDCDRDHCYCHYRCLFCFVFWMRGSCVQNSLSFRLRISSNLWKEDTIKSSKAAKIGQLHWLPDFCWWIMTCKCRILCLNRAYNLERSHRSLSENKKLPCIQIQIILIVWWSIWRIFNCFLFKIMQYIVNYFITHYTILFYCQDIVLSIIKTLTVYII